MILRNPGVMVLVLLMTVMCGCEVGQDGTWTLAGADQDSGGERWTIRCFETANDGHAQTCEQLATMLKKVRGIDANKVNVVSGSQSTVIYYGVYRKVRSGEQRDEFSFPPELRRDLELIASLALPNQATPFAFASPELLDTQDPNKEHPWNVVNAKGTYTLEIAVFYDTPTFKGRSQVAEEYTRILRDKGYTAFFWHDPAESYVFVGEFSAGDVNRTRDGLVMGETVRQYIAQNEAEFSYMLENGHIRKVAGLSGEMEPVLSFLVSVPSETKVEDSWTSRRSAR